MQIGLCVKFVFEFDDWVSPAITPTPISHFTPNQTFPALPAATWQDGRATACEPSTRRSTSASSDPKWSWRRIHSVLNLPQKLPRRHLRTTATCGATWSTMLSRWRRRSSIVSRQVFWTQTYNFGFVFEKKKTNSWRLLKQNEPLFVQQYINLILKQILFLLPRLKYFVKQVIIHSLCFTPCN